MSEIRRISLAAVVLLVLLRLSIGWQLLYEGLWKIDTLDTPRPWTSAGYLKASEGPLRGTFRKMAGDPDELGWLDYDTVSARWDDWARRFTEHYSLNDRQKASLAGLLDGTAQKVGDRNAYSEPLEQLPSGVEKLNVSPKIVWYDASAKRLYVDSQMFMEPAEQARLLALVDGRDDQDARRFRDTVSRLYERQKKGMGYRQKLAGTLRGNPELIGNDEWQRLGKLEQYREQLALYEATRDKASSDFQWDHANYEWNKLQTLRSELTGPVKALEADLKEAAQKLLDTSQFARGEIPEPWTALRVTDMMTIAGLTVLGTLLLLGLLTRFSAVVAAFMLFNFYMAMPPWPGVPEPPGTEHSFIINKNLIEVVALLAIATMPTGVWFGLDGLLAGLLRSRRASARTHSSASGRDHVPAAAPVASLSSGGS